MPATAIKDDDHWYALRNKHIGGSEIAVLFGLSKFATPWELHMQKVGKLPPVDLSANKAVRNGRIFESAIAQIGADKFDVPVRKVRRYLECEDCPSLGATLDYETVNSPRVPVEIKWSEIGFGWEVQGDEIIEAPENYLMQLQAQLACVPSAPYARLWAFVKGDVRQMIVEPRPKIIEAIKAEAARFMENVRKGIEPPIDFDADHDAIMRMVALNPLCKVELPPAAIDLCRQYRRAAEEEKAAEGRKKAAQAEIAKQLLDLAAAKGAKVDEQKVVCEIGGFKVTASMVAANPGTVVTEEMLGQVINARKGYRRVGITGGKADVAVAAD
jgi:putative phage-type endonuclease